MTILKYLEWTHNTVKGWNDIKYYFTLPIWVLEAPNLVQLVIGEIQGGIYEQDVLCIFDDHPSNSHTVMLVYHIIHRCTPC